jgi:hypothetical protein
VHCAASATTGRTPPHGGVPGIQGTGMRRRIVEACKKYVCQMTFKMQVKLIGDVALLLLIMAMILVALARW